MSIKIISASKVYTGSGGKKSVINAVKNISLDINEGSFTVIFGPTGSGKTTLLSLLAGIVYPTNGDIIFNNVHLSHSRDNRISQFREKNIGFIPQNTHLIKELTVFENILSPNSFYKIRLKELKSNALYLLEKLKLIEKKDYRPLLLSGGEIKKVMIARALVKNPFYIIADEPFSELDGDEVKAILKLLDMQYNRGTAVIIASNRKTAFKKKVDLYTMNEGQIAQYRKGGKS